VFLCAGLLGVVGCGGAGDGGDDAARVSRVAVQIRPADQTSRNTLPPAAVAGQPRVVPTDPSDPAFVSRIDIRVEGQGISTPITQTLNLTAAQQEQVTTSLEVPSGQDRHIVVRAFNANGDQVFGGDTTRDLLEATVTVTITLSRVPVPEDVDPADLANQAFAFANSDAFGVSGEVTLSFSTFTENTGAFTLTANGQTASGNMTIVAATAESTPRGAGTPRQETVRTRCRFTVDTSNFPSGSGPQAEQILRMAPCAVDALDGNLILRNASTDRTSTSAPPTPISVLPPNALRIGSPSGPVASGETFTVAVEFNAGTTHIVSYLLALRFNSNVVEVLDIEGLAPFDNVITNPLTFATGTVLFAANNTAFTPATGLLNLANITFQVVGSSGRRSTLVMSFPSTPGGTGVMVNEQFQPIEGITFVDGSIQVQ
jgi:hypothetical protein